MKITKIKIDGFKILKKNLIKFDDTQIFPEGSQILGLIGSNGSGKTTFCSAIAWTFQSIFTRKKLDFDIEIEFKSMNFIKMIKIKDQSVKLIINKSIYHQFKLGQRYSKHRNEEHRNKVYRFWDGCIVLSTFETSGEYPYKKPYNWLGHDPLIKYDTSLMYGKNSFAYPSITKGITRFLEDNNKQTIANSFLNQMGFRLSGKVEVKIVSSIIDQYQTDKQLGKFKLFNRSEIKTERTLYKLIKNDTRINLTNDSQLLDGSTVLNLCNDYSQYMGKYIFINSLELIKDDVCLNFNILSSGEKFFIIRYMSILSGVKNNSIIIVEEPENHLNPKWRELIIPALHKIATAYNSTLIFTTHDHRIIRYLHNNCVLNTSKGKLNKVKTPTLLCDEFDFESISEKTIPFVYNDLIKVYSKMTRSKKATLLDSMCNVEEKMMLRKKYFK